MSIMLSLSNSKNQEQKNKQKIIGDGSNKFKISKKITQKWNRLCCHRDLVNAKTTAAAMFAPILILTKNCDENPIK